MGKLSLQWYLPTYYEVVDYGIKVGVEVGYRSGWVGSFSRLNLSGILTQENHWLLVGIWDRLIPKRDPLDDN